MELCVSSSQVMVLNKAFAPLKSDSSRMEYNQILPSYFREQGGVLNILIKIPTNMMCYCYGKMRPKKIEESSFSSKTHIHTK